MFEHRYKPPQCSHGCPCSRAIAPLDKAPRGTVIANPNSRDKHVKPARPSNAPTCNGKTDHSAGPRAKISSFLSGLRSERECVKPRVPSCADQLCHILFTSYSMCLFYCLWYYLSHLFSFFSCSLFFRSFSGEVVIAIFDKVYRNLFTTCEWSRWRKSCLLAMAEIDKKLRYFSIAKASKFHVW